MVLEAEMRRATPVRLHLDGEAAGRRVSAALCALSDMAHRQAASAGRDWRAMLSAPGALAVGAPLLQGGTACPARAAYGTSNSTC